MVERIKRVIKLKVFFNLLMWILVSANAVGQCSLYIADQANNSPLPYATIINYTQNRISLSNEQGVSLLDCKKDDSIKITYIGYEEKVIKIQSQEELKIKLVRKEIPLANITVKPCPLRKLKSYSNTEPEESSPGFGGLIWNMSDQPTRVAVMVQPNTTNSKLYSISLDLSIGPGGTKESIKSPLRFLFYAVDDSTKLPGQLLTEKTVLYKPVKKGPQVIGVDSLNLYIPEAGFYVGIEQIMDKQFSYPVKLIIKETGKDTVEIRMGATINGTYARNSWMAFYSYTTDEWWFGGKKKEIEINKQHGTIKFGIEFLFCAEQEEK